MFTLIAKQLGQSVVVYVWEVKEHMLHRDTESPNLEWNAVYRLLMTSDKLPWDLSHTGHLCMGRAHNIGRQCK